MPIVLLIDCLLIPAVFAARWRRPLVWIGYPVADVAYSLLRGAAVDWCPYPFLDPRGPADYAGLVGSAGAVVVGCLAAALVLDQAAWLRRRIALDFLPSPPR
ncbi:MAG: hypothetical protein JWP66_49 [Naasia sp.]|nr:hypothetical protein [Naasia sp.]